MITLSNFKKEHKKVDFRNPTYNKVQDLCFELFGIKTVIPDLDRDLISIISLISLTITFDRNETKMYFHSYFDVCKRFFRTEYNQSELEMSFSMCQSTFRVFDYESAERYLRFKKDEVDLIHKIDG